MVVPVDRLRGGELIETGIADLEAGRQSVAALVVAIGAPRLSLLGLTIPSTPDGPEHRLYELLVRDNPDNAHARYNALIRRLVSFERACACAALADAARVRAFMRELGRAASAPGQVFLAGGASAVLMAWRETTVDIDLKLLPDQDSVLRAVPALKESLELNVELATPDDFIPVRPGWQERSPFIAQEGHLTFRHFDFSAQALAKIERGHARDLADVAEMLARGLVTPDRLRADFAAIEPLFYRYPALDPPSFRRALETALANRP